MNRRRSEDRLYTTILMAFLVGLVSLGLLGVPALLVAAVGGATAAIGVALLHFLFDRRRAGAPRRPTPHGDGSRQYVPSVLEGSSTKRRRRVHLRLHRRASAPLRFR